MSHLVIPLGCGCVVVGEMFPESLVETGSFSVSMAMPDKLEKLRKRAVLQVCFGQ